MYEEYVLELNSTADDLVKILSQFSDEEWNKFPAPEKWSAGQMTDHVHQSLKGSYQMLSSPGKKAERPVHENIPKLKSIFLDFTTPLKSPDFILPKGTIYNKQEDLQSLDATLTSLRKAAAEADLSTMTSMKLPVLGEMSKLEALYFMIVHTQRHVHQAKNIYEKVTGAKV